MRAVLISPLRVPETCLEFFEQLHLFHFSSLSLVVLEAPKDTSRAIIGIACIPTIQPAPLLYRSRQSWDDGE